MENALLISGSDKGLKLLKPLMEKLSFNHIQTAESGSEARRALAQGEFSLVVINAPVGNELGFELALWIAETTYAGVVLLIKQEQADELTARAEDAGVLVLGKPLNDQLFSRAVRLMLVSTRRVMLLQSENHKLLQKLEETRLVARAKCVLMENRSMSENDAHRYIEKAAMDHRVTRMELAREILEAYA